MQYFQFRELEIFYVMSLITKERVFIVLKMAKSNNSPITVQRAWKAQINRHPPTDSTMRTTYQRFIETGSVDDYARSGRPSIDETKQEQIKALFQNQPRTSIREASLQLTIPFSSVQKSLKEAGLKNFRITMVQRLSDDDKSARSVMCESVLENVENNDNYLDNVLFSDEAKFFVGGCVNKHNCRIWGYENPHVTMEDHFNLKRSMCGLDSLVNFCLVHISSTTI